MLKNKSAVVLLSGGMDSTVVTAIALELGYEVAALHLNYKQRTEKKELLSFQNVCDYYQINKRLVVDINYLAQIGGSSLTDFNINVSYADLENKEIPSSYVPFRNANILAIATSWAEVINADAIFIGAVEQDSSGYPDCRKEFFTAMEKVINLGTKPETNIKIITPIIDFSKKEVVEKGIELKAPLNLSWSCYQNSDEACGKCDSCALRLRGFELAGIIDPIKYRL